VFKSTVRYRHQISVEMSTTLRCLPRAASRFVSRPKTHPAFSHIRSFSSTLRCCEPSSTRPPPPPPEAEAAALHQGDTGPAPTYLGTTKRLPEFNLVDKVVLVSGAARGLGLVQAEALLEAGATGTFIHLFLCTHSTFFKIDIRKWKPFGGL
jgi:hypothetical protein